MIPLKKTINIIISAFVLFSLNATGEELDYNSSIVDGWTMYKEKKKPNKKKTTQAQSQTPSKKATIDDLQKALLMIVVELRKTRQELNKIKKILNPNPQHYIVGKNGNKCLANSDKDCFEMPIVQEARNIPSLEKFMKNPTLKSASKWLGVQAKIFNRANDMGIAIKFASLQGGANTYPVSGKDFMNSGQASNAQLEEKAIEKKLQKFKNNIGTIVFLGETPTLEDTWGQESLARMVYPQDSLFNLLLVFKNQKSKTKYDGFYKKLDDLELRDIYMNAKKIVSSKLFKTYDIKVSPSVVAVYKDKKNNKFFKNTIVKGFPTKRDIVYGYKQFLIFNKLIEYKSFHSDNLWRSENEK